MDAGISSEANIRFLRSHGYQYLSVTQANLLKYKPLTTQKPTKIQDKPGQTIELLSIPSDDDTDNYLYVKSHAKAIKESSMNALFNQRFEQGFEAASRGISKKAKQSLGAHWTLEGKVSISA